MVKLGTITPHGADVYRFAWVGWCFVTAAPRDGAVPEPPSLLLDVPVASHCPRLLPQPAVLLTRAPWYWSPYCLSIHVHPLPPTIITPITPNPSSPCKLTLKHAATLRTRTTWCWTPTWAATWRTGAST